ESPIPPPMTGADAPRIRMRRSRKGLIIGFIVVAVLVVLVGAGIAVTTLLNRSSNFAVGSCVKQDGSRAQQVDCNTAGAFRVVSKEDQQEKCADRAQPFVVIERSGGKKEVLCLQPANQK